MKKLAILGLLVAAAIVAGCTEAVIDGSGNVVTESRDVSGFDAVALGGTGVLTITVGQEETLTVTADDNLLEHIETKVEDGRLLIGRKRDSQRLDLRPSAPILYDLTVVELGAIAVSGSGSVFAKALAGEDFSIAVSGAAEIGIEELTAGRLTVAISGSGDVSLGGRADVQAIAVSGSGEYRGDALVSERAECGISGSGHVTVWVEGELDASISGSGSVSYYGEPDVRREVSGSGSIRSLGPRKLTL